MKSLCHITTAHPRNDVRIFFKECGSASTIANTSLIVADGNGNCEQNNINIVDIGKTSGRFSRLIKALLKAPLTALKIKADIYHFHDPELLFAGLFLTLMGKKVIYDAHEDLPRQILSKPYLKKWICKPLSVFVEFIENFCCRFFAAIVTATPHINQRFLKLNSNSHNINNFPKTEELVTDFNQESEENTLCYAGGITQIRGLKEILDAVELSKTKLLLAGKFNDSQFEASLKAHPAWSQVEFHGLVNRNQVLELYSRSKAGLVTFHPCPNHINSQPNKLFEYMGAGLPIIASNFDLWKQIIEKYQCGILVDPQNPESISDAIKQILDKPEEAQAMGKRGCEAVKSEYNWESEEKKLFNLYQSL
jgi:glycosyltransferase involved in cell wall biosynthesis